MTFLRRSMTTRSLAFWSKGALAATVVLAAGSVGIAEAQTCPAYAPRLSGDGFYMQRDSGCSEGCAPAEPVRFVPTAHLLSPFQPCDHLRWDFGDGTAVETAGAQTVEHTFAGGGFQLYTSYRVTLTVTNALGTASGHKDVTYRNEHCDPYYAHSGTLDGEAQGCGTERPCKVGDAVQIVAEYAGTDARYCDGYTIDFGDHSAPVTLAASAQTPTPASVAHQFARDGKYNVIVTFGKLGPPPPPRAGVGTMEAAPQPLSVTIPVDVQAGARRRAVRR
jgi:hypothetical protein